MYHWKCGRDRLSRHPGCMQEVSSMESSWSFGSSQYESRDIGGGGAQSPNMKLGGARRANVKNAWMEP